MEIGKMRHRITLLKSAPVNNENGFETEELQEYATVWAEVTNLYGKEYFSAKAVQEENTVKFTIRFLDGINQEMLILFQGRSYNITGIDHIKYNKKYIEIKALEVNTGG